MINNRQGGRRRGRGGQRPQGLAGRPDGNRQDNRQRGNAAQLLEKYKSLARDAQLAGDRVQSEYYLQYADHYFRVLGESRARYEEQRRQRGESDELEEEDGEEELVEAEGDSDSEEWTQHRQQQRPRDRDQRRPHRESNGRAPVEGGANDEEAPRRGRPPRREPDERIALEVVPPSIGDTSVEPAADEDAEAGRRPRRRTRRPRLEEGGEEIAPAA